MSRRVSHLDSQSRKLCAHVELLQEKQRYQRGAGIRKLHAAPLSGKRLLALWNALPGVEKRRRVGDREALIDQLWSAIEALPDPEAEADAKLPSKQDEVVAMLRRPEGGWSCIRARGLHTCHVVEFEQRAFRRFVIGPAFRDIAKTPGITATALQVFLTSSHPKMPNLTLTPEE
jgi:hypothetical protein